MASLPSGIAQRRDEDDQQPLLSSGGTPAVQALKAPEMGGVAAPRESSPRQPGQTQGMGVSQTQQQSAMQPRGSGYINLQSFLTPTVAKQNQGAVRGMGADLTGKVSGAFDSANTADRSAITANAPKTTNYWDVAGLATKAGGGDKVAYDKLAGLLGQTYAGPDKSTFDLGANADNARLGKLGGAATALDALHPGMKGENGLLRPRVTQGTNWLDRSLIQGDAGTLGEISKVKGGADELAQLIGGKQDETAKLAGETKAGVDKAREDARGVAKSYIDVTKTQAEQNARSANAQTDALLARAAAGEQGIGNVSAGPRATAGNFLDKSTAGGLSALAEMLGDPSLGAKSTGAYKAPTFTQTVEPNAAPTYAESPLDYSDNYRRDQTTGHWQNTATGEVFDGTWQYLPQSNTWKNALTGETKGAGQVVGGAMSQDEYRNAINNPIPGGGNQLLSWLGAVNPLAPLAMGIASPMHQDALRAKYNDDGSLKDDWQREELQRRRANKKRGA
jgi:hypothetical protein